MRIYIVSMQRLGRLTEKNKTKENLHYCKVPVIIYSNHGCFSFTAFHIFRLFLQLGSLLLCELVYSSNVECVKDKWK